MKADPVAVAAVLGGLNQPFDLCLGQVLPCPQVLVGWPFRGMARLEGRQYEVIKFRNGYAPKAPEMLVEFRGLRRYGKGRNAYYAILLGRVLDSYLEDH